jgi:hypothetical protein
MADGGLVQILPAEFEKWKRNADPKGKPTSHSDRRSPPSGATATT